VFSLLGVSRIFHVAHTVLTVAEMCSNLVSDRKSDGFLSLTYLGLDTPTISASNQEQLADLYSAEANATSFSQWDGERDMNGSFLFNIN